MELIRDPERIEVKKLTLASQFTGREVLEIGCGDGWLTWQYAGIVKQVVAIDPSLPDIQKAKASQPNPGPNISLVQTIGEALPFPSNAFDISVFSSSL